MSPEEEEQFEQTTFCWLCEGPLYQKTEKVRDHDHLSGKLSGAAHTEFEL